MLLGYAVPVIKDFYQLDVWKHAMDLAVAVHALTEKFPKTEVYGITPQMRRASVSIAANIAEGFGRFTYPDKRHKYIQARGELTELMNFFYYVERVGYISLPVRDMHLTSCTTVHRMLNALIGKMGVLEKGRSSGSLVEV